VASRGRAEPAAGDGVVAELVDRIFENPAMSGGLMVVALTATAIVSNAMFLQSGHHPDPLFMTRPTVTRDVARPGVAVVPHPRTAPMVVTPPLPRLAPVHAQPAAKPEAQAAPADSDIQLITAIQRELARLGLYSGTIDGISGARTLAAISAYENAAGLSVSGPPTAALLEAMKQPLPQPAAPSGVSASAKSAAAAAELDQRERARADAIAAEQRSRADDQLHRNYRIVQSALNRIGYGPITVDGLTSPETADAIRRFELDNGLPISGEASETLIAHMIAIGAIKPT